MTEAARSRRPSWRKAAAAIGIALVLTVANYPPAVVSASGEISGADDQLGDPWAPVRACESGGDYAINTGNGFYGAYQFTLGTWDWVVSEEWKGTRPDLAPPHVQDQAAETLRTMAGGGLSHWPVCGQYYDNSLTPLSSDVAGESPGATAQARNVVFPILGEATFRDDFGEPRGGGTRPHEGNDVFAAKHTPALATVDGVITTVLHTNAGNAGNMVVLTDDEGWSYNYIHLNNDTPGSDDDVNDAAFAFGEGVEVGARVRAGDLIGYVGDSGNAEDTAPHLHFEIRRPDDAPVSPFLSLQAAVNWGDSDFDFLCRSEEAEFRFVDLVVEVDESVLALRAAADDIEPAGTGPDDGGLEELGSIRPWRPGDDDADSDSGGPDGDADSDSGGPDGDADSDSGGPDGDADSDSGGPDADSNSPGIDADSPNTVIDASVVNLADAGFRAALGDIELDIPTLADIAVTPDGRGMLLLDRSGEVQEFGSASYFGGLDDIEVLGEAAAIAMTSTGRGYWVADTQGDVHPFGDASSHGSLLLEPDGPSVVDLVPTSTDDGYLLLLSDGTVVAKGRAGHLGSVADLETARQVSAVSLGVSPSADGYWVLDANGRVFTFGDMEFLGSPRGGPLCNWSQVIGTITDEQGHGLWVAADDLQLWPFGSALDAGPLRPSS